MSEDRTGGDVDAQSSNSEQRVSARCGVCGKRARLGFIQPASGDEIWLCKEHAEVLTVVDPIMEVRCV